MVLVCGVPEMLKIRWGFSFLHKPDVFGVWSHDSISALNTDKTGASTAYIEVNDIRTRKKRKIYEVPFAKYERFEWVAAGSVDLMTVGSGDTPIQSRIIGCKLVTEDFIYSVMISGKLEKIRRWDNG